MLENNVKQETVTKGSNIQKFKMENKNEQVSEKNNNEDEKTAKETDYIVIAEALNVREFPKTDAKVVTIVKKDNILVSEEDIDGEWLKITKPIKGFVMGKFINKK